MAEVKCLHHTMMGITSGGITGAIEVVITFPTEYVKTQLQLDERMGAARRFKGPIDCTKQTIKSHGFRGLYRGLSVLLYAAIPKSAVRFGGFEEFKRHNVSTDGTLTPSRKLLCGMGAGVCEAILVVTPMETVKVKFINDQVSAKPHYRGFIHGVRSISKEFGLSGLYKGVTPTIFKQGTNQAIRFFTMESLKEAYRKHRGDTTPNQPVPKLITGLFGIVAGTASVYGNTPLDVIKTRMQGLDAHNYRNTLDCARKILRNEGPLAFYKGAVPRLGRVCLDVCISFMIYDSFMEYFAKVWPSPKPKASKLECRYHPYSILIEDAHAGDMVCSTCGLVVAERAIDVGSEWRTFANDANAKDMSRVGAAENPLFSGSDLSTMIGSTSYNDARQLDDQGRPLYRNRRNVSGSDRALISAFKEIGQMAERLNLPKSISDHANMLFKQVHEAKTLRGRSNEAVCTACLYMACRQEGVPRTFKEVCAVTRVAKKDVGKVFKKIVKGMETDIASVSVEDFMTRFCANLNLDIAVQQLANTVARRALNLNLVSGRSPVSVAAAAIYMAALALGCRKEKREIGDVAGCAEATITCTYRAMLPKAAELFPDDVRLTVRPEKFPP